MTFQAFLPINTAFRVNNPINTAFEHCEDVVFIRVRRLLEDGVYFTFPFPNVAFKIGNTVLPLLTQF